MGGEAQAPRPPCIPAREMMAQKGLPPGALPPLGHADLHPLPGAWGSCSPGGEAGTSGVASAAIHPLLHIALAGTTLPKRLLSQALWGAQGRAATGHAWHHGTARGAPCRTHGAPQNLQESQSHQREPSQQLFHRVALG